jgi:predicted Zn-dependent peptidase
VRAINSLKRELTLLGEKKLSGVQIANLKEQIKGGYFLSMESTSRRMSRLAKNEIIYGREISEEEIVSNINKITAHSICEAAQIYLNSSKINTVILSPEKV